MHERNGLERWSGGAVDLLFPPLRTRLSKKDAAEIARERKRDGKDFVVWTFGLDGWRRVVSRLGLPAKPM